MHLDPRARVLGSEGYRILVEEAVDAIWLHDLHGRFTYANRAARTLTGYGDGLVGTSLGDLLGTEAARDLCRRVVLDGHATIECEIRARRGHVLTLEIAASSLPSDEGPGGVQAIVRDVTTRRAEAEALRRQALHDPLTGLPNRTLLSDRIGQAVLSGRRNGTAFALLVIDLDRFKEVNDELGHHGGDTVLVESAHRIRGCLRASDTVARFGGDEFVVLLRGTGIAGARIAARKLTEALAAPAEVDGRRVGIGASVGIAIYGLHGEEAEELLARADAAMYAAKRGRRRVAVADMTDGDHVRLGLRHRFSQSASLMVGSRMTAFAGGAVAAVIIGFALLAPQGAAPTTPAEPAPPVASAEDGPGALDPIARAVTRVGPHHIGGAGSSDASIDVLRGSSTSSPMMPMASSRRAPVDGSLRDGTRPPTETRRRAVGGVDDEGGGSTPPPSGTSPQPETSPPSTGGNPDRGASPDPAPGPGSGGRGSSGDAPKGSGGGGHPPSGPSQGEGKASGGGGSAQGKATDGRGGAQGDPAGHGGGPEHGGPRSQSGSEKGSGGGQRDR